MLIRFLKNVWKQKLVSAKLKCIPTVAFPRLHSQAHEQEKQSKKAAIIYLYIFININIYLKRRMALDSYSF